MHMITIVACERFHVISSVQLLVYMKQTTTKNKLGIDWNDVIKKKALDTDDDDLGKSAISRRTLSANPERSCKQKEILSSEVFS